jgi:hypothetical protein
MLLTERMGLAERIAAQGDVSETRRRWSERIASFACGVAIFALMPMLGLARDDLQVSLMELSAMIVASLMLGVGLRLHLRFVAERIGSDRLRWMMLVLLAWATAGIGAANWPYQLLAIQFVVGVIAGATLALGLPGLPALYGGAASALLAAPLCRALMGTDLGVEGSWPLVCGAVGGVVLFLAGVTHLLVRPTYVIETGSANESAEPFGEELPVPAAA